MEIEVIADECSEEVDANTFPKSHNNIRPRENARQEIAGFSSRCDSLALLTISFSRVGNEASR